MDFTKSPINFTGTSGARGALEANGNLYHASGNGDWTVNQGGAQVTSGGTLLLIAGALLLVYLLRKG